MNGLNFSLVIGCYNEERVLEKSVKKIIDVFEITDIKYEIIFVDDKSTDNTVGIIKEILKGHIDWQLIEHGKNLGRGKTVADGIRASRFPIVGFIDLDLSTSPGYLPRLIYEVKNGVDIATALSVYKLKPRTLFRWIFSKGYNFLVRHLLECDLSDTETGCKVFNRARMLPLLETVRNPHWFWDTEIMLRSRLAGHRIKEVPSVFIREGLSTTVRVFKDTKDYMVNLIRFRRELNNIRKK